jgi:hypothetical protein
MQTKYKVGSDQWKVGGIFYPRPLVAALQVLLRHSPNALADQPTMLRMVPVGARSRQNGKL